MNKRIERIVSKNLEYILTAQQSDGRFESITSTHTDMSYGEVRYTTFTTSLILLALRHTRTDTAYTITMKGIDYLLTQRHKNWSWNYWDSSSDEAARTPDDMDATSCALAAITLYRPELIDGAVLACSVKSLIQCEEAAGGPYHTWIIDRTQHTQWRDIDPVVNANILYFLGLHNIQTLGTEAYLSTCIENNTNTSLYYSSPVIVLYFLARTKPNDTSRIRDEILKRRGQDGMWANPLETALAISALLYCGPTADGLEFLQPIVEHFISMIDTSTPQPYPLYIERTENSKSFYSGSAALTAAFYCEALDLYAGAVQLQKSETVDTSTEDETRVVLGKTTIAFISRFKNMEGIKDSASHFTEKIHASDPRHEITLLPYFFNQSLKCPASEDIVHELGQTNLAGWIAYRIYDDLLDGEAKADNLPLANVCLRDVVTTYQKILPSEAQSLLNDMFDVMENANAYEYINKRSASSADKSLPHCLGPVTLLLLQGYTLDDASVQNTILFFRYYLTARQLNDDAHDWQADLDRGFTNTAAAKIFTKVGKHTTPREDLVRVFWNESIREVVADILENISRAREVMKGITALREVGYLESLLTPLEAAAMRALTEQKNVTEFLASYTSTNESTLLHTEYTKNQ